MKSHLIPATARYINYIICIEPCNVQTPYSICSRLYTSGPVQTVCALNLNVLYKSSPFLVIRQVEGAPLLGLHCRSRLAAGVGLDNHRRCSEGQGKKREANDSQRLDNH